MRLIKNTTELIGIGIKTKISLFHLFLKLTLIMTNSCCYVYGMSLVSRKEELAFVAQKYETNELHNHPDNRHKYYTGNYFWKLSIESPTKDCSLSRWICLEPISHYPCRLFPNCQNRSWFPDIISSTLVEHF